jgi:hypothetical protein
MVPKHCTSWFRVSEMRTKKEEVRKRDTRIITSSVSALFWERFSIDKVRRPHNSYFVRQIDKRGTH